MLVGVVYDPIADELFWAIKGGGAWIESPPALASGGSMRQRLTCSSTTSMARAVIGLEVGYSREPDHGVPALLASVLSRRVRSVRMLGSSGLNMAYVACGRLDAVVEEGTGGPADGHGPKIWDFSAGKLLG